MSQSTAGTMLADLLRAKEAGASLEELNTRRQQLGEQIEHQASDPSTKVTISVVSIDEQFVRAGHKPENKACNHAHYSFDKHGRYCTCGTIMVDFGD